MSNANYSITCSKLAVEKAKERIIKRNNLDTMGIRLGIRGSGCNGFMVVFEFADKQAETDHIFEFDGVRFIIDAKSMLFLNGTHIDYETTLMNSGFKFDIPKQASSCGCGSSISFNT